MLENPNLLNMVCTVEPLLWFMVLYGYSRSTVEAYSRNFRLYLAVQMTVSVALAPMALLMLNANGTAAMRLNFIHQQIFWWGTVAAAVLVLATVREILAQIFSSLVGLQRIALLSLQWLFIVAFVVIAAHVLIDWGIVTFVGQLARVSYGLTIAELVVLMLMLPLTFLVRRSARSRFQEILLGLFVLSASNAILRWGSWSPKPMSAAVLLTQILVILTTLVFWFCCFLGAEEVSQPRMLPANSALVRWSEKFRILKRESAPAERSR